MSLPKKTHIITIQKSQLDTVSTNQQLKTQNSKLKTNKDAVAFEIVSNYSPAGDQAQAIERLTTGIEAGLTFQTLLGVTGSGKTYTIANVIEKLQKPTIVMAPNKTLAAQLYGEFKELFPNNSVEYFVSYYDYYQPEAYVVASDTFIDKDSSVNSQIEQMRLSATKALMERRDVIVVASVSCIYGLGDPKQYLGMMLHLVTGDKVDRKSVIKRLVELQYMRNSHEFERSNFRVRGDIIDIFPADSAQNAVRIELFDDAIDSIHLFDPLTGKLEKKLRRVSIYPKSHYVTSRDTVLDAIEKIKQELTERLQYLRDNDKLVEAQRLEQRTKYDIEMMLELGYCTGIENYSRYLSNRNAGEPPPTLLDYLPKDALVVLDESHITIPQIGAMYKGDRARKETLVQYGFRLPSALDNRPLRFEEWEQIVRQGVFVSATPADYEAKNSSDTVELLVRPTAILDPEIEIRSAATQVDDVIGEIKKCVALQSRVLITVLTKKMAENLADFLSNQQIKVRYLHSDIDSLERMQIIRDLRLGKFDVLIGINLLREGLDMPEVSLVAIFDADKEGFLRSERSLIQTIGRAARNIDGRVIFYADRMTNSMQKAIDESNRRRQIQIDFNTKHGLSPKKIDKQVLNVMDDISDAEQENTQAVAEVQTKYLAGLDLTKPKVVAKKIVELEKQMYQYATDLEFEKAANLRDEVETLRQIMING